MENALKKIEKSKRHNHSYACNKIGLFVLLTLLIVSIFTNGFGISGLFANKGNSQEMIGNALAFINDQLLPEGSVAKLGKIDSEENVKVNKFKIIIGDKSYDSFVSEDGKYLFPNVIKMADRLKAAKAAKVNPQQQTAKIVKSDKPNIGLFVMSYCPFGLQSQKTMLPVYELLKDKADIKIHFCNYAMHGKKELDENLRQYCLQKESAEKYIDYLGCFVKDGDSEKCLLSANVDQKKLNSCISSTDKEYKVSADYDNKETWLNGRYPVFNVENDLNETYKVGGSPTIVINGRVVNVNPRTPENYKAFICRAFNVQPKECSETLSTETPAPSFGSGTAKSSGGSCD
ncbi:hypothetical protein B6D52_02940 [Candidatus Parcubacteria bacterium 4484_255]|nr:MAG: hypothetical protein B6D52_02940 [Candidatus Parcubacteria bacterium 4484_255]